MRNINKGSKWGVNSGMSGDRRIGRNRYFGLLLVIASSSGIVDECFFLTLRQDFGDFFFLTCFYKVVFLSKNMYFLKSLESSVLIMIYIITTILYVDILRSNDWRKIWDVVKGRSDNIIITSRPVVDRFVLTTMYVQIRN